ncbi:nuclear transport factor 2 family protein [Nakamurella lactea]|uniref:nuclear transport factor 2 family protein n=1 Tax=Nakamurella lactea TaxID=459515 RepID=UPI0003FC49E3|nr:nuclear transport factor 2 family protein [Nakamurella lactea]
MADTPDTTELLAELRRLRDHEEIRQLMYRYARGVDRSSAGRIASVYAEGGTDKHGLFDGPGTIFAEHVAAGGRQLPDVVGNHHITNILIEVDGDTARAETYFLAIHPHRDDDGEVRMALMSGRYVDSLVRENDVWGIKRRLVTSDFSLNDIFGEPWQHVVPTPEGFLKGGRGSADPSNTVFADLD